MQVEVNAGTKIRVWDGETEILQFPSRESVVEEVMLKWKSSLEELGRDIPDQGQFVPRPEKGELWMCQGEERKPAQERGPG